MKSVLSLLRLPVLAVIAAIAFTGCLEWDHQVLTYRYDRKSDTLLIFQDYRGIYGADNPDKLLANEISQLKSVLKGGRTFFFANWVLEINLQALPGVIADLRDKAADSVAEQEMNQAMLPVMELFAKNCTIENGDFYLDGKGRISVVQRVKIAKVSQLFALLNPALKSVYKHEAAKHLEDLDRQTYLNQVIMEEWKFVRFQGNQLIIRVPLSAEDYEEEFRSASSRESMDRFTKAGIRFEQRDGVLTCRMGQSKDQLTRIGLDPFSKEFRDNLRAHLPADIKVKKQLDTAAAARRFVLGR